MMANTADAAPRRPANAVRACCLQEERKGVITRNTATGLAINVSPRKMSSAGYMPELSYGSHMFRDLWYWNNEQTGETLCGISRT